MISGDERAGLFEVSDVCHSIEAVRFVDVGASLAYPTSTRRSFS